MLQSYTLLIATLAALVGAAGYFQKGRKDRADAVRSRELSARDAWEKYLVMAFENPRIAMAHRAHPRLTAEEHEKYEWFVSRMLYAAEEVLIHVGPAKEWRKVFRDQVEFHENYLKYTGDDGGNQYLGGYSDHLKAVFRKAGLTWKEPEDDENDAPPPSLSPPGPSMTAPREPTWRHFTIWAWREIVRRRSRRRR